MFTNTLLIIFLSSLWMSAELLFRRMECVEITLTLANVKLFAALELRAFSRGAN